TQWVPPHALGRGAIRCNRSAVSEGTAGTFGGAGRRTLAVGDAPQRRAYFRVLQHPVAGQVIQYSVRLRRRGSEKPVTGPDSHWLCLGSGICASKRQRGGFSGRLRQEVELQGGHLQRSGGDALVSGGTQPSTEAALLAQRPPEAAAPSLKPAPVFALFRSGLTCINAIWMGHRYANPSILPANET